MTDEEEEEEDAAVGGRGSSTILLVAWRKNNYGMKVGSFMFTSKKRDIYYTFSGATRASTT